MHPFWDNWHLICVQNYLLMKHTIVIFSLCLFSCMTGLAQHPLEGLWVGSISNNLSTDQGHRFELLLQVERGRVSGRSFIYLPGGRTVVMTVTGRLFDDQSVGIEEMKIENPAEDLVGWEQMFRKYQMAHDRSIWSNTLEGHWQEMRDDPLDTRRKVGRLILRKTKSGKA